MDAEVQNESRAGSLRVAIAKWAACLTIFFILVGLYFNFQGIFGTATVLFYFAAGFYLNRVVLRDLVEWHPMYNTVNNVANEKLSFFFFWPVTYFVLFFKLAVNKLL